MREKKDRKKRVVLCGYYGFGNVGDEAVLTASVLQLRACDLTVLSASPEETAKRLSCRAVPRMSPLPVLRTVFRCDALVFGGGSILQDVTGNKTLWYYLGLLKLASLLGKETYLLANGVGPLLREKSRRAVGKAVEKLTGLTLRDEESASLLRACGVKRRLPVSVDAAAMMALPRASSPIEGAYTAVVVRPWGDEEFEAELVKTLDGLTEAGKRPVLIPFHPDYDRAFTEKLASRMAERPLVREAKTVNEAASLLSGASAVLAMRLHALIFASLLEIPAAGIVYDPKVAAFLKTSGQASCGTVEEFTAEKALAVLLQLRPGAFHPVSEEAKGENARLIRQILSVKENTI